MINKLFHKLFLVRDELKIRKIEKNAEVVFGPANIEYAEDEAIVLCLVRNGETWIEEFIAHYKERGFVHIVFLDTGSTDQTEKIARRYANITFLTTTVPFKNNNVLLRRYLVERFACNRWSLTVDIDELWSYPFSDKVSLSRFLQYVKDSGANAVVAQMLDMFMEEIPQTQHSLCEYDRYDISDIHRVPLSSKSAFPGEYFYYKNILNTDIPFLSEGVRLKVFGLTGVWLTKMPLLFNDVSLEPFVHQHFSNNATIADVSTVLLHYKFTHTFLEQVQDALAHKQYANDSKEYRVYAEILKDVSSIQPSRSWKRLTSIEQLIDEGFLVVSGAYKKVVNNT